MRYITGFMAWVMVFAATGIATGQNQLPQREYTHPDELVVLTENVPFSEALVVFEELSQRFRNKSIVDRSGFSGAIGVPIPRLHWRDALDRIASYHNLVVREGERQIEIVEQPVRQEAAEPVRRNGERVIDFNTREIEIKATFFEGSRQLIRELGIDWTSLHNGKVRVDNVAAAQVTEDAFSVEVNWDDIGSSGWDISALFNAFESSNKGEVLSSPNIKVMDGETGRIQVGQDFSIRQRDFAGNVIDEFFSTGTILEVTPNVLYHQGQPFIYMTVQAERSTAAPGAVSTVVNKQEANTEILMLSGESTVIGGLYETETSKVRRGVPILKDLPGWFFGLRYLFGYSSTNYNVQELVVVLEANLVPTLQERLEGTFFTVPELIEGMREEFELLD
ncbi:type II and III secretion system protein [Balneolales bacterium ANBcel1]|nr:type II and III secretion system protein [Balneolales bacterium ANBcel1]